MSFGEPDETRMYNVLRREIREIGNGLRAVPIPRPEETAG